MDIDYLNLLDSVTEWRYDYAEGSPLSRVIPVTVIANVWCSFCLH